VQPIYFNSFLFKQARSGAIMRRNAGIPDDLNMALGGWRTRAMLDRYLGKKRTEDLRNATAKLDAFKLNRRQTVGKTAK
jgi:hypothetical protein